MSWSKKMPMPIRLRDGRELHTLSDAGELILRLPDSIQQRSTWTYATELLMQAAKSGRKDDMVDACHQVARAAKADGMLARA